jgi:hypothetical protein
VRRYCGHLPLRDASEALADQRLKQTAADAPPPAQVSENERRSEFQRMFRQGATLVPRMLCLVDRKHVGRLGASAAAPLVASHRSVQEKSPWKTLPGLEHPVEAEFLRPIYLGESILPFKAWRAFEGVVPMDDRGRMIDGERASDLGLGGLAAWMTESQRIWSREGRSDMTLVERWNYHNELGAQFPVAPLRVLYAASGTNPAACIVRTTTAVIEHGLYWAQPNSEEEGLYLTSILNSEASRSRVELLQARGLFGARHFDKVMFTLPIPRFSEAVPLHRDLAAAARQAEALVATIEFAEGVQFQRARRTVRDHLREVGLSERIDDFVRQLLDRR